MKNHTVKINLVFCSWPFGAILFLAALSLGAWHDFNKPKSETQNELLKKAQANKTAEIQKNTNKVLASSKPAFEREPNPAPGEDRKAERTEQIKKQSKEVEKLRAELKDIIKRTNRLQGDLKENRSEIQSILERARIHQKILQNITLPQPVPIRSQINAEEIIRREKLRLIAEQAHETQQQLRLIQQTRLIRAPQAPTGSRTSKTS